MVVVGEAIEVFDEHGGETGCFLVPFSRVGVGILGVEDAAVDAGEGGGDRQVEVGQGGGFGVFDLAAEDGVDDRPGSLDGDALAGAVPAGVDQVGLGVGRLHALDQYIGVLGRVQAEEGGAEAGGEGGRRLGDAALGAGQLGGEA